MAFLPVHLIQRPLLMPKRDLVSMFKHWSLSQKMLAGYGLAFAVTIGGITAGFSLTKHVEQKTFEAETEAIEDLEIIGRLQGSLLEFLLYKQFILNQPEIYTPESFQEDFIRFAEVYARFKRDWLSISESDEFNQTAQAEALTGITDSEREVSAAILEEHGANLNDYMQQVDAFLQQVYPSNIEPEQIPEIQAQIQEFNQTAFVNELDSFIEKVIALQHAAEAEENAAKESLLQANKLQLRIVISSILLSGTVGIVLMQRVSQLLLRPLQKVTKTAHQSIQYTNFDLQVPIHSYDEVGALAQTFNNYIKFVKRLLTHSKQLLHYTQQQANDLRRAKEAADAANRAKSEFLAYMSHELRTPLNAILGFTQLIQKDVQLPSNHRQAIDIIGRSGEHLLNLINDILEISKIESGQIPLRDQPVNLRSLLSDLEKMFKLEAESKGLKLIFDVSPELPQWVKSDKGKLCQILINLLGNAVKFTNEGQVYVQAQLLRSETRTKPLSHSNQHWLSFTVSDTGVGIAEEEIKDIFSAFGQTQKASRAQEGSGLGLAISSRFVKLMGGDIKVHSRLKQGSTFSVKIPVEPIHVFPKIQFPRLGQLSVTSHLARRPYRILAVDDDPVNRLLLNKIFSTPGFEVKEAHNGQQAIQLWQNWRPDLILMDMRMPVMDGYAATRWIKQQREANQTLVIALTASAFEEERQAILDVGCDDFIPKPFHRDALLARVTQHLEASYHSTSEV